MQRLVYSPKAYVFIRRKNGEIANVSKYVVSGSVNRRLNAVSTANIVLRNPKMVFTAKEGKHAAFQPMDPITIYLQRLRNRQVRVFTGFLDETPYYELYPGTIELSASCTLKKLLYTYFDPALPYTRDFLAKYGWMPDGSGGIMNPSAITGGTGKDGGMGQLLFATMHDIGGWKNDNIKIERLPTDLIRRMANLFSTFRADMDEARQEIETLIHNFVGSGSYGNSGGDNSDVTTGQIKGLDKIIPTMIKSAKKWKVPAEMIIATWLIEWPGLKDNPNNPHYGWFQWDSKTGPPGSYAGAGVTRSMADGCYDCGFASDLYAEAASRYAAKTPSLRSNTLEWTMRVQGVNGGNNPLYPQTWDLKIQTARNYIDVYGDNPLKLDTNIGGLPTESAKRRDGRNDKAGSGGTDQRIYAPIAGGVSAISSPFGEQNHGTPPHTHMGIDVPVPTGTACVAPCDGKIGNFSQTTGFGGAGGMIHFVFTNKVGDIGAGTVIGWGHVSQVFFKPGATVKGGTIIARSNHPAPHVHFIMRQDSNDMDGTVDPTGLFHALQKGETTPTSGGSTTGTDNADTSTQIDEIVSRSNATLLAATLNWSTEEETLEAVALTGAKSLMNDKPLLPFIQQMTDASLRQFQSMPNGDFFAFYPDYFGETFHRPPYWYVNDVEILDGRVKLNDAALVTHEYVVGDTSYTSDSFTNKILSVGVVSIVNAFVSDIVTTRAQKDKDDSAANKNLYHAFNRVLKQDEAIQFLQRYGARPNLEEYPMVRHPFFELFLAYQHFMQGWARQFLTPFQFTFMPELYPGGKIGIPDHGLQMYIEEVTHTWDYSSGFVTQADLSSPAVLLDKNGDPMSDNLPINMPTALMES